MVVDPVQLLVKLTLIFPPPVTTFASATKTQESNIHIKMMKNQFLRWVLGSCRGFKLPVL